MNELPIDEAIRRVQAGNVEDYRIVVVAFHQRLRTGIAALCPLEASTNLVNWTWLGVRTNLTGTIQFTDMTATNFPKRFYRVATP